MSPPASTDTSKTRKTAERPAPLGREDWIAAAWDMLGAGSLDQVRVDALARKLGVTRGSFYWHFRNRDDLVKALLDRWFQALGLDQSMRPALRHAASPQETLWIVLERVIRRVDSPQFVALRMWAMKNAAARQLLREEDERRVTHFATQFAALGFTPAEAQARASVYFAVVQGEYMRHGALPLKERLARARAQHDWIVMR